MGWILAYPCGAAEPKETTGCRGEMVLDGVWQFCPSPNEGTVPDNGNWGEIRVPGSWAASGLPGVGKKGAGAPWLNLDLNGLSRAWYRKSVRVPAEWSGRAVILDLERVSTDAVIYLNGTECGAVHWPGGECDITRFVQPGTDAEIRLRVGAFADKGEVEVFMGHDQVSKKKAALATRGLIGSVRLESRPAGGHVSDVFVQTSTRNQKLSLQIGLDAVGQAGPADVTASLYDEKGNLERQFQATIALEAQASQTATVEWGWDNPRLWDLGKPNLYALKLAVKGAGVNDEYAQTFGFREFWIEGRKFLLNGKEIRFRPIQMHGEVNECGNIPEVIDARIDDFRFLGFNLQEFWPFNDDERGVPEFRDVWYDRADRKGWAAIGSALSMAHLVEAWDQPGVKKSWSEAMLRELKKERNHPSILFWITSPNRFGSANDQDPRAIGRGDALGQGKDDGIWNRTAQIGREAISLIHEADPTRPATTHHGASVGDIHTLNFYLNFIPLQEREEWFSDYVKNGDRPFLAVETGTPLDLSYMRGRKGLEASSVTEPFLTEFAAIYLGGAAYGKEAQDYRAAIARKFQGDFRFQSWQGEKALIYSELNQSIQSLFQRNSWRSWRTAGVTGGFIPWIYGNGWSMSSPVKAQRIGQPEGPHLYPAGEALRSANQDALAWICGPPECYTAKDHHFTSGETVVKQAALLNDGRDEQTYNLSWKAELDGKTIAEGKDAGVLPSATTRFVPISFPLPDGKAVADGVIYLKATIGAIVQEDRFSYRCFSKTPPAAPVPGLVVYDPLKKTTALLDASALSFRVWGGLSDTENAPRDGEILVIGRDALAKESAPLLAWLKGFVDKGGRTVIFSQQPDWFRDALGLRVSRHLSRQVYGIPSAPALFPDLDDRDFADWNGSGTLVEARPLYPPGKYPAYGWRWGATGSVSSAAIEKPHRSGWRPLLECEFDLAYSPLMELSLGNGKLWLCTLDLEDRSDPVAMRVTRDLLAYVGGVPAAPRARTVYLGGDDWAQRLNFLGLDFQRDSKLPDKPDVLVLVDGDEAALSRGDLAAYAQRGGRVVVLAKSAEGNHLGARCEKRSFHGSLSIPAWPECSGLSLSDLHWRADRDAILLAGGDGLEVGADGLLARYRAGKGCLLFSQFRFDSFDADSLTYFRFTRWRQTRALCQVLANMGASFSADSLFFAPKKTGLPEMRLEGPWLARMTLKLAAATSLETAYADPGITEDAQALVGETAEEKSMVSLSMPSYFQGNGASWSNANGETVLRRGVTLGEEWQNQDLLLELGKIDDFDITYFNGHEVGRTGAETPNAYSVSRVYRIPAQWVKPGRNVIAVRVFDRFGNGGIKPPSNPEEDAMRLSVAGAKAAEQAGWYYPDYRRDFPYGDEPYRYYRW